MMQHNGKGENERMQQHHYDSRTLLLDILEEHPWLADRLPQIDRRFAVIRTAPGRLLLRTMRVEDLSRRSGMSVDELLAGLENEIRQHEQAD